MKAKIDQSQTPHSRSRCDTYRYTPYGGAGPAQASTPPDTLLDPRGLATGPNVQRCSTAQTDQNDPSAAMAPGRCLRLTETHRLIDGEPDAVWDWEAEVANTAMAAFPPEGSF